MSFRSAIVFAAEAGESGAATPTIIIVVALLALVIFGTIVVLMLYGKLWFRAYMSGAYVRLSLVNLLVF